MMDPANLVSCLGILLEHVFSQFGILVTLNFVSKYIVK